MSSAAPTREVLPPEMDRHRVAWLMTENRYGHAMLTKVRFATDGGKIYTLLQRDSAALRQILGRPQVRISLGKGNQRVRGPEKTGMAFVLPPGETSWGWHLMARKYWWLRVPFLRGRVLVEIVLV